jgi:hypothetical protein
VWRRFAMNEQPTLSDDEWRLIVELLEREQSDLSPEIHHTRTADVRDDLRARKEIVRSLLERLRPA